MTNTGGEEKTISVSNNLVNLAEHINQLGDLSPQTRKGLLEKVSSIHSQVNRIHDRLEDATDEDWNLEYALENIADELYYNGVYTNEV